VRIYLKVISFKDNSTSLPLQALQVSINRDMAFISSSGAIKKTIHTYSLMTFCVFLSLRLKERASSLEKTVRVIQIIY